MNTLKKFTILYWPLIVIVLITSFLFFIHLGRDSLTDWDECVYAQQAKEMKQTGNFLTPMWNKEVVFEKPPLYNWVIQGSYLFGVNELTARIPMVIFGELLLIFVYIFTKRYFDSQTAVLATLLLLASQLIVTYSVHVNTDIGFTLFVFLGFFCWILTQKKSSFSYLSGLFFGLAVMNKGLGAIPYLAALFLTLFFNFKKEVFINYLKMGLTFLIVIFPWHAYEYLTYGWAFVQVYFIEHVLKRANNTLDFHFEGRLFYVKLIGTQFFPWILSILILPLFYFKRIRQFIDKRNFKEVLKNNHVLLTIVTIFIVVLISITRVKTRISWYAMPLYPFISIIIASSITAILKRIKIKWIFYILLILLIANCLRTVLSEVRINQSNRDVSPRNAVFMYSQKLPQKEIEYLVWKSERVAQAILPQSMQTSTTFVYGGNPCAVYYSNKKVNYFYNTDKFQERLKQGNGLFVIENGDKAFIKDIPIKIVYQNSDFTMFTR